MNMDAKQKMDSPVICPNGRTAAMGCDLLVTDNLDVTTVGAQVDSIVNDRVRYPMRLSSTCIIIGSMQIFVNWWYPSALVSSPAMGRLSKA